MTPLDKVSEFCIGQIRLAEKKKGLFGRKNLQASKAYRNVLIAINSLVPEERKSIVEAFADGVQVKLDHPYVPKHMKRDELQALGDAYYMKMYAGIVNPPKTRTK